jgi:excisionase family DNA binding protein
VEDIMEKLLITAGEAADLLGLGRTKVYELMAAGRIESVKIGRSRRLPVTAVHEFIERLMETAA